MGLNGKSCNLVMRYEPDPEKIRSQQACGRLNSRGERREPETEDWDCLVEETQVVSLAETLHLHLCYSPYHELNLQHSNDTGIFGHPRKAMAL
ncbi:hypothetical protein WISP_119929 [Willisornis vidua]|uniref:Uncharacterized protein n=1 Tax=Willisornis vidua TaxID=1566151 RepID=A0ABQ9CY44_9PASS|nr:hypothetical protein WISP_119929 [Willisornis vidua]